MRFICWATVDLPVWSQLRVEPDCGEFVVVEKGRIVTATAGYLALGVRSGFTLERARGLSQKHGQALTVRTYNPLQQGWVWQDWLMELNRFTPWLESRRPGLALSHQSESELGKLARWSGLQVGAAGDRQTAYLAALASPPGHYLGIGPGQEDPFRAQLPISVLESAGISGDTLERLVWMGFARVAQLATLQERQLKARFQEGERLARLVLHRNRQRIGEFQPPPVVEAWVEAEVPWSEPGELEAVFRHLLEQARGGLQGRLCRRVTALLELEHGGLRRARRALLQPGAQRSRLWTPLWKAVESQLRGGEKIDRAGVELGDLVVPQGLQGRLFRERSTRSQVLEAAQARCPGQLMRLERQGGVVPEESWCLRPLVRQGEPL